MNVNLKLMHTFLLVAEHSSLISRRDAASLRPVDVPVPIRAATRRHGAHLTLASSQPG